jgi:ubiquinone/menaquinone biosynthesis C-methylase UbiE
MLYVLSVIAIILLMRMNASFVYDFLFVGLTQRLYEEVLERCPKDAKVLDIGIGTATSLVRNAKLVKAKNLKFVGVDYDKTYCKRAVE